MTARAMWKGRVAIGQRCVPVKLYAAQSDRRIHFRLLHRDDLVPVAQRMVDPTSRDEVPRDDTQLAASDGEGRFVILDDDELAALEPEPSRTIEVMATLPTGGVPGAYVSRAYYLGPDGDDESYRALVAALDDDTVMLVRWVMRKRDYVGAIAASDGALSLVTLRSADEVLEIPAIEPRPDRAPSEREVDMAHKLIEAMDGPFEPERYTDRYREEVIELAEKKAAGKRVAPRKRRKRAAAPDDLEASLAASLKGVKKAG